MHTINELYSLKRRAEITCFSLAAAARLCVCGLDKLDMIDENMKQ